MTSQVQRSDGLQTPEQAIERIADYEVVDVDVHDINVHVEEYAPYMDEPYRGWVEHVTRTDEPLAGGIVGGLAVDIDPTPHGLGKDVKTTTVEGMKAFMDRFNIDYVLLHGHQIMGANRLPEADYAFELNQAYTRWLLDNVLDEYDGFKAGIRVTQTAPEKSAELIDEFADEDDFVSVAMSTGHVGPLLGAEEFHPIYEAAADNGLAMDYHIGSHQNGWVGKYGVPYLDTTIEDHIGVPQINMAHIASQIFEGVPERFPDLEHVYMEQGIVWLPWLMGRMDKNYERRNHRLPDVVRRPSEYLLDNFSFGTQPLEESMGARQLLDLFDLIDAENTLMFSTDFPHFDFDFPSVLTIPRLEEDVERKVFGENALEVFDF